MTCLFAHRLSSAIVLGSFCALVVACSSNAGSAGNASSSSGSSASNGTSPAPLDREGFCARRKCIEADVAKCEAWAKDFSDAFLAAFETCGDDPACIKPKLAAAPLTDRQRQLADDYCKPCGGTSDPTCVDRFWGEDGPGETLRMFSDEKLDEIDAKCLPDLAKNEGSLMAKELCGLSMSTCTLDFVKALGSVICRARP